MAIEDYVEGVRDILEGQGLGEKPTIVQCAATASVTASGKTCTFTITGNQTVKAGDVLSNVSPDDSTKAYCFYVLDVTTNVVTARNGYKGAPAIANASTDLDSGLLYLSPMHLEHKIHDKINTIFAKYLWPFAFAIDTTTIASPTLASGLDELPADFEDMKSVYQIIGVETIPIGFAFDKPVPTGVSSTGVIGYFDYITGTTAYLTYIRKLALGDEDSDDALVDLVSTGAAALMLGASVAEMDTERAKKDDQNRKDPSATLWRDFLTARASYSEDLSRDTVTHFRIERG